MFKFGIRLFGFVAFSLLFLHPALGDTPKKEKLYEQYFAKKFSQTINRHDAYLIQYYLDNPSSTTDFKRYQGNVKKILQLHGYVPSISSPADQKLSQITDGWVKTGDDIVGGIPIFTGALTGKKTIEYLGDQLSKPAALALHQQSQQLSLTDLYDLGKKINSLNDPALKKEIATFLKEEYGMATGDEFKTMANQDPEFEQYVSLYEMSKTTKENKEILKKMAEQFSLQTKETFQYSSQLDKQQFEHAMIDVQSTELFLSNVFRTVNPEFADKFHTVASQFIALSETYAKLRNPKFINTATETLFSVTMGGLNSLLTLGNLFLGSSSGPNSTEMILDALSSLSGMIQKSMEQLHEHLDLIHKDMRESFENLTRYMSFRLDNIDFNLQELRKAVDDVKVHLSYLDDFLHEMRKEHQTTEQTKIVSDMKILADCKIGEECNIKDPLVHENTIDPNTDLKKFFAHAMDNSHVAPFIADESGDLKQHWYYKAFSFPFFENIKNLTSYAISSGINHLPIEEIRNPEIWSQGARYVVFFLTRWLEKYSAPQLQEITSQYLMPLETAGEHIKSTLQRFFYYIDDDGHKVDINPTLLLSIYKEYQKALQETQTAIEQKRETLIDSDDQYKGIDPWRSVDDYPIVKIKRPYLFYKGDEQIDHDQNQSLSENFSNLIPPFFQLLHQMEQGNLIITFENARYSDVDVYLIDKSCQTRPVPKRNEDTVYFKFDERLGRRPYAETEVCEQIRSFKLYGLWLTDLRMEFKYNGKIIPIGKITLRTLHPLPLVRPESKCQYIFNKQNNENNYVALKNDSKTSKEEAYFSPQYYLDYLISNPNIFKKLITLDFLLSKEEFLKEDSQYAQTFPKITYQEKIKSDNADYVGTLGTLGNWVSSSSYKMNDLEQEKKSIILQAPVIENAPLSSEENPEIDLNLTKEHVLSPQPHLPILEFLTQLKSKLPENQGQLIDTLYSSLLDKIQDLSHTMDSDIINLLRESTSAIQKVDGFKTLLFAYVFLGLNTSFIENKTLQSFFDPTHPLCLWDSKMIIRSLHDSKTQRTQYIRDFAQQGMENINHFMQFLIGQENQPGLLEKRKEESEIPVFIDLTLSILKQFRNDLENNSTPKKDGFFTKVKAFFTLQWLFSEDENS